jgi:pilus assembly protein CpaF
MLRSRQGTLWIDAFWGWGSTRINGMRIVASTPVAPDDRLEIGPYTLTVSLMEPLGHDVAAHPHRPSANTALLAIDAVPVAATVPTDAAAMRLPEFSPPTSNASIRATHARLHGLLLESLDLRRENVADMSDRHLRARAHELLTELLQTHNDLCQPADREAVLDGVLAEAVGLGPLEPLLADDAVTEIMVSGPDRIFTERSGQLCRYPATFTGQASLRAIIDRIVSPIGRRIDESAPMVNARLPDGSRVNAVIAPVALSGPVLTIRKFSRRRLTLQNLVTGGALTDAMAGFLTACVKRRRNIVVAGGTGAGKTTLLNILAGLIAPDKRIATVEDAAELQLAHDHVVALEARPANSEGRGQIDIRDLVRNALRMRPDRIVVGECRGPEAFDMLAAMNTGHEGSLTTLHANTPRDALARLETMILMAGMGLPLAAVREHIAAAIDIVVQQARWEDGRRVVTHIAEVGGLEGGTIQVQPIFMRARGASKAQPTGVVPACVEGWRDGPDRADGLV